MDQLIFWILLHEEVTRRHRKASPPSLDDPFRGREWDILRTIFPRLSSRRTYDRAGE